MRQVQVYIEGNRIELFNDEQIQITSSVQNISDISKVFTDFSQSFTVPASTVNNEIFQHFYQSDVDSTIDHNIRRSAIIEIDLTTFRRGKIQIEKANIKDGLPENYQLTFYGEIRTLKDAFGEDKLNQLDLSSLEFQFTAANIYDRITDLATDYDVRYPLIASNRLWTYQHAGEDVTNTSHAISFEELFPAVKVSKLFEAIESQYGITFTGTFLTDPRFTNVFLYGKNSIEYQYFTEISDILLDQIVGSPIIEDPNLPNPGDLAYIDIYEDKINIIQAVGAVAHVITFDVLSVSVAGTFYIEAYQDGNYYQTFTGDSNGVIGFIQIINTAGLDTTLTFKLKATDNMTVELLITYQIQGVNGLTNYAQVSTVPTVLTGNVSLNNTLPDIKVSDFFSGVLKEFNATCVGVDKDVFEILPLDDWYQEGAIVDITEYTDIDSIDVERIKLYKKIAFKYQQSESFVNRQFFKLANTEYGNTEYQFAYDGSEYVIEVPFENLLFTRAEKTNTPSQYAIFGYCLNENYQAYTPKPILLYLYGSSGTLSHNIKFFNGASHDNISSYALFGQDLTYQNTKYSLNFGAENSIIHLETIQNGLYAEYYFPYLMNLYNLKNRLTYVKTNLPISLLTNLRLNDRVIIRDKRYIINEMKSNLTTGEVNFSLYLDFRPMDGGKPITITSDAQCIDVKIPFINGAISATITTSYSGVTITPSTITSSQAVEVCVPANANTTSFLLAENSDFLITEEFQNLITENSTTQVITLVITYTFANGTQVYQQIILQQ
jgi:hypothetical protein